jgi:hypothetical protein
MAAPTRQQQKNNNNNNNDNANKRDKHIREPNRDVGSSAFSNDTRRKKKNMPQHL